MDSMRREISSTVGALGTLLQRLQDVQRQAQETMAAVQAAMMMEAAAGAYQAAQGGSTDKGGGKDTTTTTPPPAETPGVPSI